MMLWTFTFKNFIVPNDEDMIHSHRDIPRWNLKVIIFEHPANAIFTQLVGDEHGHDTDTPSIWVWHGTSIQGVAAIYGLGLPLKGSVHRRCPPGGQKCYWFECGSTLVYQLTSQASKTRQPFWLWRFSNPGLATLLAEAWASSQRHQCQVPTKRVATTGWWLNHKFVGIPYD